MKSSKHKPKTSRFSILLIAFVIFCLLITSFYSPAPPAQTISDKYVPAMPFTQAMVEQSVVDTLNKLSEVYVFPLKMPEIRADIMHRFTQGRYSNVQNNIEFAEEIGKDLREVSGDLHLGVLPNPRDGRALTPVLPPVTEKVKHNFAFERMEVLTGNIGYLKFNKFDANPDTQIIVDHAIGFLARTDALIIDLRDCIGGSPQLVSYIISHFIEEETLLWTAVSRGEEQSPMVTQIDIGPQRFKHNFPLFILVGPNTTSAAEVFAFTLQQLGKAIIVGQQTRGITHAVSAFEINDYLIGRFSTLWLKFPFEQQKFEGQGVSPDFKTPLENSLEVAHTMAKDDLK